MRPRCRAPRLTQFPDPAVPRAPADPDHVHGSSTTFDEDHVRPRRSTTHSRSPGSTTFDRVLPVPRCVLPRCSTTFHVRPRSFPDVRRSRPDPDESQRTQTQVAGSRSLSSFDRVVPHGAQPFDHVRRRSMRRSTTHSFVRSMVRPRSFTFWRSWSCR